MESFSANPVTGFTDVHLFAAQSTTELNEKVWGEGYTFQISTVKKRPLSV